ncbi:hypothetical protein [Aureivirga sp. CE67]|uniref:hypothetical protein n=1 Tax=Aureivirga sp. CE67 TaxID=1788983 RepID=UPI0018CB5639|nr:hypothetical protein [Aureivirga sp. CE67]
MKKNFLSKVASLALLAFVLVFTSCKDDDEDQYTGPFNGSIDSVENFYNQDIVNVLNSFDFPINTGDTPPNIEGAYYCSPLVLESSNIPTDYVGNVFLDYEFTVSNQNTGDLTIDFEGEHTGGSQVDFGTGTFISGNGNDFTVYLKLTSQIGSTPAESAMVLSGTIAEDGIENLEYALLMIDNNGNPEGVYIPNNGGRHIVDYDGFSESITAEASRDKNQEGKFFFGK